MLQYPDVSQSHITFSYGGDIWIVNKEGGNAYKLTTAGGMEQLPKFSPDGSYIAFSGNYDGNTDIYLIPSLGGVAKKITFSTVVNKLSTLIFAIRLPTVYAGSLFSSRIE